jgi:hypothetical protein
MKFGTRGASIAEADSAVPTCLGNLSPSWVKAITWESAARVFGPSSWNGTGQGAAILCLLQSG